MSNLKTLLKIFAFVAIAIISLFIIALLVNIFMWSLVWGPAPNHRQMERDFQSNKEQLFIARDFLIASEFDSITIRAPDSYRNDFSEITVLVGWEDNSQRFYIPINDEKVLEAIRHLFQQGCRVIGKGGNDISFQRWANLDVARGIVYSIDGSMPDASGRLHFLTEIEPLSEEGWYFYISDFNEWKRRNR